MKRFIICAAMALTGTSVATEAPRYTHQYTGAADQPVITLDYQGSRVPRINAAPTLSIFADGRIEMPRNYAHMRAYSGRISQDELQQILDLAIRQERFFDFDEHAAHAKRASLPGNAPTLPEHLSTTVITLNADGRNKTVSQFGLGHARPIEDTGRLLAIRTRLEQVMSVVKLGGETEAGRWLALANAELHSRQPDARPLALIDLRSATVHADGSAYVRFARADAQQHTSVSVSIAIDEHGRSNIAVARDDLLPSRPVELD